MGKVDIRSWLLLLLLDLDHPFGFLEREWLGYGMHDEAVACHLLPGGPGSDQPTGLVKVNSQAQILRGNFCGA